MPLNENLTPEELEVVRQLRADAHRSGKSLRQIAREAPASPATVSQVMNGNRWPSPTMFRSIVRATTGQEPSATYKAAYERVHASSEGPVWDAAAGVWRRMSRRRRELVWVLVAVIMNVAGLAAAHVLFREEPERCRERLVCDPWRPLTPKPVEEFYTTIKPARQPWPVYQSRTSTRPNWTVEPGTQVLVLCDVAPAPPPFSGEWVRIQLPDGMRGWINTRAITTVRYEGGECYLPRQKEGMPPVSEVPRVRMLLDGTVLGEGNLLVWNRMTE